jgi:hypothetical protein
VLGFKLLIFPNPKNPSLGNHPASPTIRKTVISGLEKNLFQPGWPSHKVLPPHLLRGTWFPLPSIYKYNKDNKESQEKNAIFCIFVKKRFSVISITYKNTQIFFNFF